MEYLNVFVIITSILYLSSINLTLLNKFDQKHIGHVMKTVDVNDLKDIYELAD